VSPPAQLFLMLRNICKIYSTLGVLLQETIEIIATAEKDFQLKKTIKQLFFAIKAKCL